MLVLTRPWNCLSAAFAVLVGVHIARANVFHLSIILAMLTAIAITAGGNVTNDYFDQEIDTINKPKRPLPSLQVEPRSAVILAIVLFIVSIVLSFLLGSTIASLAATMAMFAFLYSWKLKKSFLIGNLMVAFLSSMTIVYGGLVVGHPAPTFPSMLLVFVFILSREILKTAEDSIGDAAYGVRTIAVKFGCSTAARLFVVGTVFVTILIFWPWFIGQVSSLYLVLVLLGVVPVLLISAVGMCFYHEQRHISLALRATKLIFFVWLTAMLIG